MRVLWVCNIMLPRVAEQLHMESSSREGWLTGLSEQLLAHAKQENIELAVCFPTLDEEILTQGRIDIAQEDGTSFVAYPFREDVHKAEVYDKQLEKEFAKIISDYQPDILHCFGTEFPHTLASVIAFDCPEKSLIGIQGLCSEIAGEYPADIPVRVWNRKTFRDRVKRDDLRKQRDKYILRGNREREAIRRVRHIAGRTIWDQCYSQEWNEKAQYHLLNETLRDCFYSDEWSEDACQKGRIFISQGDYPLKGLHYLLQAMPMILEKNPEAEIYVAGNSIIKGSLQSGFAGIKERLKLESYGKYILELLKKLDLINRVHFAGPQDAQGMKEQYLKANVFVNASALENSPNSLGEAMLLGVPCVASKVGGVPSLFKDRLDGLLYEKDDIVALAGCVNLMLEGGDLVDKMRKHARDHARQTHNQEENYRRLLEIYHTIAKEYEE